MGTAEFRPSVLLLGAATIFLSILSGNNTKAIAADESTGRDRPLEKAVVEHLQSQGLGHGSRIVVLAVENKVFLLGAAPDANTATKAVEVTKDTPDVGQVENLLVVRPSKALKSGSTLEQAVQSELGRLRTIPAGTIEPETAGETVFLMGRAESWPVMAQAVQAAFAAGADYVVSELSVGARESNAVPQVGNIQPQTASTPGSNTQSGTQSGEQPAANNSSFVPKWGQSAQDQRLQRALELRLRQDIPEAQDFYVLVMNGQAFLYGRVLSQQEKQQAGRITRDTPGIVRYRNQLLVGEEGWRNRDDAQVEKAIREDLTWNPFVDTSDIKLAVTSGVATLSGTVGGFATILAAVDSAFLGGASHVINELEIAKPPQHPKTSSTATQRFGPNNSK